MGMSAFIIKDAVLFDLTWFLSWPARTGIQRYVFELARNWPKDRVLLPVIVDDQARLNIITFDIFSLLEEFFLCDQEEELLVISNKIKSCVDKRMGLIDIEDIPISAGLFLPETTYNWTQVWFYSIVVGKFPDKVYVMTYDFISWLSPDCFPHLDCSHYGITGYLRLLRTVPNLGFLSNQTKATFETRILRRAVQNPIVLGGGSEVFKDTVNRPDNARPEFVFIGTVQLRKQHFLVLDVFEKLWASGCKVRLTFVGQAGNISEDEADRLQQLAESQPLFSWERGAADNEVREVLSYATALLYPSTEEGLGLPLLEGLRAGIPAIVSQNLPALEFASGGYLAIDVNFDNLEKAVRAFLDPAFAEAKRREIVPSALPTWKGVAQRAADWIYEAYGYVALEGEEGSTVGFNERFVTAKALHRLEKSEGAALVYDCFKELFGRAPIGSEVVSWMRKWERSSPSKLDLVLLMVSSREFINAYGVDGLQKWVSGMVFYKSCPEITYDSRGASEEYAGVDCRKDKNVLIETSISAMRSLLDASNENFIELCYKIVLDRSPDDGGSKGYRDWLAEKKSIEARKFIISEFINSDEAKKRKADEWRRYMLDMLDFDVFNEKKISFLKRLTSESASRSLLKDLMDFDGADFISFALRVNFGKRKEEPSVVAPEELRSVVEKAKYLLYLSKLSNAGSLSNGLQNWLERLAFPLVTVLPELERAKQTAVVAEQL
ncbi:glycosyltransferase [Azospirillum sp. Sh1]|nr:glycosyltransferase [Azospirillum sp. Sh1]